jgi:hypothetical protein
VQDTAYATREEKAPDCLNGEDGRGSSPPKDSSRGKDGSSGTLDAPSLIQLKQGEVSDFPDNAAFFDGAGQVWQVFRKNSLGFATTRFSIWDNSSKVSITSFDGNCVVEGPANNTALGFAAEHLSTFTELDKVLRQINAMLGMGIFGQEHSAYLTAGFGFSSKPRWSEGTLKFSYMGITGAYVMKTKKGQFVHSIKLFAEENLPWGIGFTSSLTTKGTTGTVYIDLLSDGTRIRLGGAFETGIGNSGFRTGISNVFQQQEGKAGRLEHDNKVELFLSKRLWKSSKVGGFLGRNLSDWRKSFTYGGVSVNVGFNDLLRPLSKRSLPQKIIR